MGNFYLQIHQVERTCLFKLSWGQNQQIVAEIAYPENVIVLYKEWQKAYRNFYSNELRGKVLNVGKIAPLPLDWHAKLVQAEAKFLYEFHQWLRSRELYDIRAMLSRVASSHDNSSLVNNIFISCNSLELTHLPWEAWEIGAEFTSGQIRIVRQPLNIHKSTATSFKRHPGKVRILAIFGDSKGLNFQQGQEALLSINKLAEVKFVEWNKEKDVNQLKQEIITELTRKKGWDILFFAGHSNQTTLTGGEISIAPNTTISLSELEHPLTVAINQGLQFAFFNSCDGLSIADKLIGWGLSEVAVMREVVHNCVAEEIFVQFLNTITQYKDVHEALLTACDYLKLEKNLTYPSADLIPSLFRHPDAKSFRLQPSGIRHQIKQWLPKGREVLVVGTLLIASLLPPVQETALDWQIGMQAAYRYITGQVLAKSSQPPVLVVHVDEKSLADTDARKFNPIDRTYLAKIINELTANNAKVIGIDYLLDRMTKDDDKILAQSIENSINKNSTWIVFGAILNENNPEEEQGVRTNIASLNSSLQGFVDKKPGHLSLLEKNTDCTDNCPFTYLLALVKSLNQEQLSLNLPQPSLSRNKNLRTDLVKYLNNQQINNPLTKDLNNLRLSSLSSISEYFVQSWLYPIIDYSLPPNQVYQVVSAGDLLNKKNTDFDKQQLQQKVILIGAGGYKNSGLSSFHNDFFPLPTGVAYWRLQGNSHDTSLNDLTGVEINAYMLQHLLKKHVVVPIPDLWMIGIAVFLGKGMQLLLVQRQYNERSNKQLFIFLIAGTVIYILMSMQMYISASIVLPLFLPSATFWFYILSGLRKKNHA